MGRWKYSPFTGTGAMRVAIAGEKETSGKMENGRVKRFIGRLRAKRLLFAALLVQGLFGTGCTTQLWDKETFNHHRHPSESVNLSLFYSDQRKDVLVKYDEYGEYDNKTRPRCYWMEPNNVRINRQLKPHFASLNESAGLVAIPVTNSPPASAPFSASGLCAVVKKGEGYFELYSGTNKLEVCLLPRYTVPGRRVKQVLLTPFAVAIDATVIGAVASFYVGYLYAQSRA